MVKEEDGGTGARGEMKDGRCGVGWEGKLHVEASRDDGDVMAVR